MAARHSRGEQPVSNTEILSCLFDSATEYAKDFKMYWSHKTSFLPQFFQWSCSDIISLRETLYKWSITYNNNEFIHHKWHTDAYYGAVVVVVMVVGCGCGCCCCCCGCCCCGCGCCCCCCCCCYRCISYRYKPLISQEPSFREIANEGVLPSSSDESTAFTCVEAEQEGNMPESIKGFMFIYVFFSVFSFIPGFLILTLSTNLVVTYLVDTTV